MRIIGGKYRSLTLAEFRGDDIRPTADRVKESLFDIIFRLVPSARVLDLFCGSGGLGLECISRGSRFVHFNDVSRDSLEVLKKNLKRLKDESGYKVTNLDFADCLHGLSENFDIIFLDPPYRLTAGNEALEIIASKKLLAAGGVAVLERDVPFSGEISGLEMYDERKYGKTYLNFFRSVE